MTTIYLAGPLFTLAEQEFNRALRSALESRSPGLTVVLPQERAAAFLERPNGLQLVFQDCIDMVDACDVVLAVVDGADADSGTCVEIGYAFARGKPIIGLRTDFRASEDQGVNLMVSRSCASFVRTLEAPIDAVADRLIAAMQPFII